MSAVNRRRFIKVSALAGAFAANATGAEAKPDRIACTTTTFRGRFPKFPLLEFPAFLKKELGLSNVEIWSRHIPEQTPEFFKKLKSAARDIGSRIINIQLDQPGYDLSNPDDTSRSKSIDTVRRWMDLAKTCGATSLRANTGGKKGQKFVLGRTADAFGQLAEH